MNPPLIEPATLAQVDPQRVRLAGSWTARGVGALALELDTIELPSIGPTVADGSGIAALDTGGAWVLSQWLLRQRQAGVTVTLQGLRPAFGRLLEVVAEQIAAQARQGATPREAAPTWLQRIGRNSAEGFEQALALLSFVGETAMAFAATALRPARWRWRQVLFNIRSAGFDALPIVGLLSFLLGVVICILGGASATAGVTSIRRCWSAVPPQIPV